MAEDKKLILVTNDDGIRSEGLSLLVSALEPLGDVFVVAPDRERSAASHSLTLHRPLRMDEISEKTHMIDGTPTDCIILALGGVLPRRPDLVVSGINKGGNLGEDTIYSGTVSAAMEATLLNIPSIAVSLVARENFDFTNAASFSAKLAGRVLTEGLPPDTLLNVNVPDGSEIKGHRITRLGKRAYGDVVIKKVDPRGRNYYWIGGDLEKWEGGEDSDFQTIEDGFISITPLHLDMTNYASIDKLKDWNF
ncbi:MAG: 5'/3'-nucleotidase SurE [Thermodesulfobacteriota bacterium]